MNKQMKKWFDSLTADEKQELHQHESEVINWGWTVFSESGGLRPDPYDTVRLYTDSTKVDLTRKQVDYLARCVKDEDFS